MAENKYDLLLINTVTDKKIKEQPWYKERVRTKYIKSLKPGDTSKMLIGKHWSFVKDGLDDFRDGYPPPIDEGDIFIKGKKGPSPNISGSDRETPVKQPATRKRFNKYEVCYSRVTPRTQQRRDHIEEVEYGLTQHPLALYPHLEECMPPEDFDRVVNILDPDLAVESFPSRSESRTDSAGLRKTEDGSEEEDEEDELKMVRNPYRWLPRKDEKDKKDKKKQADKRSSSPSEDEHIKNVTKEFCDWVSSLGGESNNIEESTITSLFASGYETKPALSVPIHVVELTNVPPELRRSAAPPEKQEEGRSLPSAEEKKQEWSHSGNYIPSWAKFKYGAWYLPTKMWKKRSEEEPLQDPQEVKDQEMSESKKKSNALDYDLAPMHGAKAFMDYLDHKKSHSRKPEFLNHIADIQLKAEEEEKAKLLAEQAKQKRLNISARTRASAKS